MPQSDLHGFVMPLCQRLAADMGYTVIDTELVKEGPGRYLRVYLDKAGGVTLDDCERFHRAVQPELERVDYDFLEISSPGADRPLKADADFERCLGAMVEARLYRPVDGQKTHAGILAGYDKESFRLNTPAGERSFARRDAAVIKPVIVFEDEREG